MKLGEFLLSGPSSAWVRPTHTALPVSMDLTKYMGTVTHSYREGGTLPTQTSSNGTADACAFQIHPHSSRPRGLVAPSSLLPPFPSLPPAQEPCCAPDPLRQVTPEVPDRAGLELALEPVPTRCRLSAEPVSERCHPETHLGNSQVDWGPALVRAMCVSMGRGSDT